MTTFYKYIFLGDYIIIRVRGKWVTTSPQICSHLMTKCRGKKKQPHLPLSSQKVISFTETSSIVSMVDDQEVSSRRTHKKEPEDDFDYTPRIIPSLFFIFLAFIREQFFQFF